MSVKLLESIIREERETVLSEQEISTTRGVDKGHEPYVLNLRTVRVIANRQFINDTENKAYVKFIQARERLNDLYYSIGSPKNQIIKTSNLEPGFRYSKDDDQTDQWKSATRTINKMISQTKNDIREARRYYNFAIKYLPESYGVTIFKIIHEVDGLYAMRSAHKKYMATLGKNAWFTSQSPFRSYYDEFGKWVDPYVQELSDDEVEQLKKSWATMLSFSDAIRNNPWKGVWILIEQGLKGGLQVLEHIFPGISDAWSSWDGFINDEDYGLRSMLYSPAGIAGSVFAQFFPTTAIAVRVCFALLVVDDIIKISDGRGSWDNWLFLILDATGILTGTSIGNAITRKIFQPIGILFGKLFKSISSGAVTKTILKQLHAALMALPMNVRIMIAEVAEGFVNIIQSVKSGVTATIVRFEKIATEYPVVAEIFGKLSEAIREEFNYYKDLFLQLKDMFKIVASITRYITMQPGIDLINWLEKQGLRIIGTSSETAILRTGQVFISTTLIHEAVTAAVAAWEQINQDKASQLLFAAMAELKDSNPNQDGFTAPMNDALKKSYPKLNLISIMQDPSRKIYMLKQNADSVFIIPKNSYSGKAVPPIDITDKTQDYYSQTADNNIQTQLDMHIFELVRIDSLTGTKDKNVSYRMQLLPELQQALSNENQQLYKDFVFVAKKKNFQKINWNIKKLKSENKNTMNLKTIIREEYSKILEAEDGKTTRKKLEEAEKLFDELQAQLAATNEQLEAEKINVGSDDNVVYPDRIADLEIKITKLNNDINTKQDEINVLKKQLENELASEQPLPPDSYYDKYNDSCKNKNGIRSCLSLKKVSTAKTPDKELQTLAAESFNRMYNDMPDVTKNSMYITSAFRSYESQYNMVDWNHWESTGKYKKKTDSGETPDVTVAEPGKSRHGLGEAMDIGPYNGDDNPADWIKENGVAYGWLWYSKQGGEGETEKEPWHFIYKSSQDTYITKEDNKDENKPPPKCKGDLVWDAQKKKCVDGYNIWTDLVLPYGGGFLLAAFSYAFIRNKRLGAGAMTIVQRKVAEKAIAIIKDTWKPDATALVRLTKDNPNRVRSMIASLTTNKTPQWILNLTSASGELSKSLKTLVEKQIITQEVYELALEWMNKNAASLNRGYAKRQIAAAIDLYSSGKISQKEFENWLPESIRNSPQMNRIVLAIGEGDEFAGLLLKDILNPKELEFFQKVINNGWDERTEINKFFTRTDREKLLLVRQNLYPTPVSGLKDLDLTTYLSKVVDITPPSGVTPWNTKKVRVGKNNVKLTVDRDDLSNQQLIKYLETDRTIPKKWITNFPDNLEQYKKEYKGVYGTLPSEVGLNDQVQMTKDYWTVQSFK